MAAKKKYSRKIFCLFGWFIKKKKQWEMKHNTFLCVLNSKKTRVGFIKIINEIYKINVK